MKQRQKKLRKKIRPIDKIVYICYNPNRKGERFLSSRQLGSALHKGNSTIAQIYKKMKLIEKEEKELEILLGGYKEVIKNRSEFEKLQKRVYDLFFYFRYRSKKYPKKTWNKTSIELITERELGERNIPYESQVLIADICIVDIYLPQQNAVIFCDGNYWHSLPRKKAKDAYHNSLLSSYGFKVYRFSETEIEKDIKKCIDSISLLPAE